MSASFGFGLCEYLRDLSADDQVSVCLQFAGLGLTPKFHERIGDRMACFEFRKGEASMKWLPSPNRLSSLFHLGGGTVTSRYDAFFEADCGLIVPKLARSASSWKERHIAPEGIHLPGTPLDGLPVSDTKSVIDETMTFLVESKKAQPDDSRDPAEREEDRAIRRRFAEMWFTALEHRFIWSFSELIMASRR